MFSPRNTPQRITLAMLTLLLAGCSAQQVEMQLSGARYADQTPGYASAALVSARENTFYGNDGTAVSSVHQWTFKTTDPLGRVVAFYEREIPGARKTALSDKEVTFRYTPSGSGPGESVLVRLTPGEIRISEEVRPDQL